MKKIRLVISVTSKNVFFICYLTLVWIAVGEPAHAQNIKQSELQKSTRFTDSSFVTVMPGSFMMGDHPNADCFNRKVVHTGPDWDEAPVHQVQISQAFLISSREVSNALFEEFKPAHKVFRGYHKAPAGDNDPVVMITWDDAVAFCKWLSIKEKKTYRLPTESEWEYAARHTDSLKLQGMNNNIVEWCADWWDIYPDQSLTDPVGPASGSVRVVRGGGATNRKGTVPGDRNPTMGFRIVQAVAPAGKPYAPQPAGAASLNVSQTKKKWEKVSATKPVFYSGLEFIRTDAMPKNVPYWGRHHVPSLTWCDNGDMLAAVFTAADDNSMQIAMLTSRLRNGANTWDAPSCFFITPDHSVNSAVLWHAPNGDIYHYNSISIPDVCDQFSLIKRTSKDNGATWSEPVVVHERYDSIPFWAQIDPVRLSTGQLAFPTDVSKGTIVYTSNDKGDVWKEMTRYNWRKQGFAQEGDSAGWIAGIHASFAELKDGSFLAFGRYSEIKGRSTFSISKDRGKTWTYRASPFPPVSSGQRPIIKRLKEGPLLLLSFSDLTISYVEKTKKGIEIEDASGQKRQVYGLFAALSFDDGKTWQHQKLIPQKAEDPYTAQIGGYLSGVQTPDNMIHIITSQIYYRFNLAWLMEPMPATDSLK